MFKFIRNENEKLKDEIIIKNKKIEDYAKQITFNEFSPFLFSNGEL